MNAQGNSSTGSQVKHNLLLDTHVWLWLLTEETEQLSEACLSAIMSAKQLGVSAISVWEIGMLESKGRIQLQKPCIDWVREALSAPKLRLFPITPEIAIESSRLPGAIHGDPADRILAATSRLTGSSLVTKDRKLLAYGQQSFIATIEA